MSNQSFGNVLYFDTNGAINKGNPVYLTKVAFWGLDTTSVLTLTVGTNAIPIIKLTYNTSGPGILNQWIETNFCNDGQYIENLSVATVTNGSGYVFLR